MVQESQGADHFVGFVYRITNLEDGKKYIGKKQVSRVIKRAPLKGKKRKRISYGQSDWEKYCGSSATLKEDAENDKIDFKREILLFCKSKGELSFCEAQIQIELKVLFREDYYNDLIDVKVRGSWLKGIEPAVLLENMDFIRNDHI